METCLQFAVLSDVAELSFQVLAAVADNGTCSLWAWEKRLQITLLDLPKGQWTLHGHVTASHLIVGLLQRLLLSYKQHLFGNSAEHVATITHTVWCARSVPLITMNVLGRWVLPTNTSDLPQTRRPNLQLLMQS